MSQRTGRWADGVNHWLIHRAAGGAPATLSERLEEEWRADLEERSSAVSRLRFALGCCWATRVIAHDYLTAAVPVAVTETGVRPLFAYAQQHWGFVSRRSSAFVAVGLLHLGVLYAFMMGFTETVAVKPSPPDLVSKILETPQAPPAPRVDVEVTMNRVPVDFPAPTFTLRPEERDLLESPDDRRVPVGPATPPQTLPSESPPHVVSHVQGGPAAGFPNPDDFYPSYARYKDQQGTAVVQVCVDPRGRLTSDPVTLQSTGSAALDEGALKLAKAGSGHYRASTDDGIPVSSCYPFRVKFQIK